jgi:hypothetical protein
MAQERAVPLPPRSDALGIGLPSNATRHINALVTHAE